MFLIETLDVLTDKATESNIHCLGLAKFFSEVFCQPEPRKDLPNTWILDKKTQHMITLSQHQSKDDDGKTIYTSRTQILIQTPGVELPWKEWADEALSRRESLIQTTDAIRSFISEKVAQMRGEE